MNKMLMMMIIIITRITIITKIMMMITKLANNMVANLEARNINQLQVQQVHPDHEIFIP